MNQDFIIGMIVAARASIHALDQTLGLLEKEFMKQRTAVEDTAVRCPKCGSEHLVEYATHGATGQQYACAERKCDFVGEV